MPFRIDIQALRGYAVLLVVLHHARVGAFDGGYLGVDIFFVISGYLITRMIGEKIAQGNFRFSEFYFRRAKRLLPAAYVVFFITAVFSVALLSISELTDFANQALGAITLTANIALLFQTGYFDSEAVLKPLLHVWSLSIEEQYYLLLPAAMVFIPRRYWVAMTALLLVASLGLCMMLVPAKPSIAFYLLPSRAWEFLIGSLTSFITVSAILKWQRILSVLFWPALCALVIVPIAPLSRGFHPGADALIICMSTAIIILRHHEKFAATRCCHAFSKVGDYSYSLYLVHWPVFAFMNNVYIGEPPSWMYTAAGGLSFILGLMLYKYVEYPARHYDIKFSTKLAGATLISSLTLGFAPFAIAYAHTPSVDDKQLRQINAGFGMSCEYKRNFTPKSECRNTDEPEIMVWGDSFAMHLVPGIASTTNKGVLQATRSMCAPFASLATMDGAGYQREWAEQCMAFNRSVLDYLAVTPTIKVVVLSSPFAQFVGQPYKGRSWRSLEKEGDHYAERAPTVSGAVSGMKKTVDELRRMGKRVIIVAPPPSSGFNIGRCLERKANGRIILGKDVDCDIPVREYQERMALVLDFLSRLQKDVAPVISFDQALCTETACSASLDGTFLYRDDLHLSYEGSILVARKVDLGKTVQEIAN